MHKGPLILHGNMLAQSSSLSPGGFDSAEGQPRRQPKNRPTPISPVAKKRGRSISSTLDDFKACPQPQDVLVRILRFAGTAYIASGCKDMVYGTGMHLSIIGITGFFEPIRLI